jgi:hypothetical protein
VLYESQGDGAGGDAAGGEPAGATAAPDDTIDAEFEVKQDED